jgi:hypothetical protein
MKFLEVAHFDFVPHLPHSVRVPSRNFMESEFDFGLAEQNGIQVLKFFFLKNSEFFCSAEYCGTQNRTDNKSWNIAEHGTKQTTNRGILRNTEPISQQIAEYCGTRNLNQEQ